MSAADPSGGRLAAPLQPGRTASLDEVRAWFNALAVCEGGGLRCVELTETTARCVLAPRYRNPNGAVNGGLLASFVDQAGGVLVAGLVRTPDYASTADLSIRYLRPAMEEPIEAEAQLVRRGRMLIVLRITVSDASRRECVLATGSWAVQAGAAPAGPDAGGAAHE